MNVLVAVALGYAALLAALVFIAALAVVYMDTVRPLLERRRSRIRSTDRTTFVEDPFLADARYVDPTHVIGGSGAGSTTAYFAEEEP